MKFSEQWLREWVNPAIDVNELADQLTMAGLEVDSITPVANPFTQVIIGEVVATQPHPDADKLTVCQVSVGQEKELNIVCGAKNVRQGLKVAVAMIGAKLSDDFKIKKSKLRGVVSEGMLCGADELGLADQSTGIMELPDDAPIGKDFRAYLQLDDQCIEVELTPNRSDCLSLQGLAREVSVLNNISPHLSIAPHVTEMLTDVFPIVVEEPEDCPRYMGRIIKNININVTTPLWMKEKLRRSGMRSIDPVVDVTNYVMLELGQPLHAFDLAKLDRHIFVRRAKPQESITLLDGKKMMLDEQTLVIADDSKLLAIAGVMGGLDSGVSASTKDLLIECAYFTPHKISGRGRYYGLHTESSHRFERGIDSQGQTQAMARVTELLLAIVGGEVGPVIEVTHEKNLPQTKAMLLRRERLDKVLGLALDINVVSDILKRLGMEQRFENQSWHVIPPSYRQDITIEEDLIEEIARVFGYNNLPTALPTTVAHQVIAPEKEVSVYRLRDALVDRGYQEIISYSFVDPRIQEKVMGVSTGLALSNPISPELSVMRTSLWTGLIQSLQYNQNRQQARCRLFEVGLRFVPDEKTLLQEKVIAGLICGSRYPEQWATATDKLDFFDIKADSEALVALTGSTGQFSYQVSEHPALHPGQQASLWRDGKVLGYLGALHPKIIQSLDLPTPVMVFEFALEKLVQADIPQFQSLSKFPRTRRDIAVLVDSSVSAQSICSDIANNAGALLEQVQLFDLYQGDGVESGQKSIALSLILQHSSRTLIDSDINELMERVIESLQRNFNATLRE